MSTNLSSPVKQREILAGAIASRLKGRGLWHPERREELRLRAEECAQQIMDDSPAGRGETIAAATARHIWENDLSGRAWNHVIRELVKRLDILG